jgi:hypothetical protein
MLSEQALEELAKPLDPKRITVGQNGPLRGIKYLEGEDVIRTANHIFGYGGWSFELLAQPWIVEKGEQGNNHTLYEVWAAHGRLTVSDAHFADVGTCVRQGAGSGGLEMAIKGAVTDCVKRCLRNMGDQFGLILYDKTADMAGIAADFSGASGVDLPAFNEPPKREPTAATGVPAFWPQFRQLKMAKNVTDSAIEAVIGTGPTMAAVAKWLEEHPETNFTQLIRLAEEKQGQLMGAR